MTDAMELLRKLSEAARAALDSATTAELQGRGTVLILDQMPTIDLAAAQREADGFLRRQGK